MDSKYLWMVLGGVAGVAGGVYDAMHSNKGIEKGVSGLPSSFT